MILFGEFENALTALDMWNQFKIPPLCGGYCMSVCLLRTFYSHIIALQSIGVLYLRVARSVQRICFFISLMQWRLIELFVGFLRSRFGYLTRLWICGYSFLADQFVLKLFSYGWLKCYIRVISFDKLVICGFFRRQSSPFTIT